ncbi:non-ribosomal peptide synthase [Nostoc minutum NIES-26]|uniref:Non-ribosomal peptide synthase n=1 Tax=Nostoc minutum NIES-26 TaxID=1844469 RepID=A0A367QZF4_9NOSO|nr:non-ribosomal peptide synthase [Nostoc minutum NIES-26]
MNVSEIVENLTQQGVQLWADDGKLKINSPKGLLTPELRTELAERKTEILSFLQTSNETTSNRSASNTQDLSLQTIGRLIGGYCRKVTGFIPPVIEPKVMAQKLKVTFKPLPNGYKEDTILQFREQLEAKLRDNEVQILPWEEATKEFNYEIKIPFINWKKNITTRVVKASVNALFYVEKSPSLLDRVKIFVVEIFYRIYSVMILKNRQISASKIMQLISWSEENIQPLEDPTNTQAIALTQLNQKFIDPKIPYQQKIPIGINTLIKTFSEIVIGISSTKISILNMNLSDSVFPVESIDEFVRKSLIPKIYVPIQPLPLSRFEVGEYEPQMSIYAKQLVRLGQELTSTNLLPSGFKFNDAIKRKSHRDIVDWMANGRTGVSYGFVAYAEPPQYIGAVEISESEWESLFSIEGFSPDELRQNEISRRYIKTKIGEKHVFKQLPDIWLISSRSGSNKTNLNIETDVLRIGLQDRLLLELPKGIDPVVGDIKPSYDIYVMVAIALGAALYAPELIKNGMPMVHFHGYPSIQWFEANNEYCTGVHNPSVPCGTYESGVFNFLGIHKLVNKYGSNIALASLIEPDHGTNIIASDLEYLLARIKTGVEQGQIELGGKHFPSLKVGIEDWR